MPREQFVEPSTGSMTTVMPRAGALVHPGLLAHDPDRRALEHCARGGVGEDVERVLPGSLGAGPDLGARDRSDRVAHGRGRTVEQLKELVGRHAYLTTSTTAL